MANMIQQALMEQILNSAAAKQPGTPQAMPAYAQVQAQMQQAQAQNGQEVPAQLSSMRLTDVRSMDDARKLAKQIVQANGVDLSSFTADNQQLRHVLEELRAASNPNSQAVPQQQQQQQQQSTPLLDLTGVGGAGAGTKTPANTYSHFPVGAHAVPPETPLGLQGVLAGDVPLPFEDSLPETQSLLNALQDGQKAAQTQDFSGLLTAVQSAVKEKGESNPTNPTNPVNITSNPANINPNPTQQPQNSAPPAMGSSYPTYAAQTAAPQPTPTLGTPRVGVPTSPLPPPPRSEAGGQTDVLQSQLQQQHQQLSLLSQLQQQLMAQQVKAAPGAGYLPITSDPHVSPARLQGAANPVAADVFRHGAEMHNAALAAEADRAWRERTAVPKVPVPSPLAVGGAFSPLASRPMWGAEVPAFSSPAPPQPVMPLGGVGVGGVGGPLGAGAAVDLNHYQSLGASTLLSESPEELEAREQAHRIMVDFIAQKNLTNLLTEKLAEKTNEADGLRARLATGEGKDSFHQMTETLSTYEKELSSERTRTLTLEHEIHKLRAQFEEGGLPLPKAKTEYEFEIGNLKRKIEMQDQMIQEIQRASDKERNDLAMETEGRLQLAANHSNDALMREIDMLKAKLRDKRNVNQELQDMLKLHLRYNSEIRAKSLLHQPQWVHPLLKEPQPSVQEFSNPTERVEL